MEQLKEITIKRDCFSENNTRPVYNGRFAGVHFIVDAETLLKSTVDKSQNDHVSTKSKFTDMLPNIY